MAGTETPGPPGTPMTSGFPGIAANKPTAERMVENEATRKSMSLFSAFRLNAHRDQLEANAKMIGDTITITSMCSFSAGRKAGNPVAVVLDPAVQYTVPVMAKIAERCVEPLVVVVQPGKKGSRYLLRLNILTPGGGAAKTMAETATIAVLQVLMEQQPAGFTEISEGTALEATALSPIGDPEPWEKRVSVRVDEDGAVWSKVPPPAVLAAVDPIDVAEALHVPLLSLQTDFPVQVLGCVGRHVIVPLRSRSAMVLDPSFDAISEVCRKYGAEGFHLFSLDAMAGGHAHTRNLSPLARSEEEPASASANACLAAYLHYHRILPIDSGETVECEQGFALAMLPRPSKVLVQLLLGRADDRHLVSAIDGGPHATGLAAQNHWAGDASGEAATRDKLLRKGDRVTGNYEDYSRFNLREGYYEEQQEREAERAKKRDAAKRAGRVYKEEEKPFESDAVVPPAMAQPAEVKECWVGGVAVPASRPEYPIDY